MGFVASYRYMLTPHSALELNYSYAQNTQYYQVFGKSQGGSIRCSRRSAEPMSTT